MSSVPFRFVPLKARLRARSRFCVIALFALLSSACGEPEASMGIDLSPPGRFPGLAIDVEDGQGIRQFTEASLARSPGRLSTGRFEVAASGSIRIRVRLEDEGRIIADGRLELAARPDFEWDVDLFYSTEDPAERCLGCIGTKEVPITEDFRLEPGESLWFAWGGREEGSDVVF